MPLSAVDTISPAFQHTKKQLIQPFRFGQWSRLALVGLLAGELSSGGGCNTNFTIPQHTGGSQRLLGAGLSASNPALYVTLIALLIVLGVVLMVLLLYANSVMRFVLFDSVIAKECHIRQYWNRRQGPGLRYFLWQLALMGVSLMGMTILVGIPAAIAWGAGWLHQPEHHLAPLILGGILVFFVFMAFILVFAVIAVLAKDFVVPQMALENISAFEGWRRLWPMLTAQKGSYAGYIGMKIVLAIGVGLVVGIVTGIVVLVVLIPLGGFGAIAVIAGKAAGLTWNAYTITLIILAGCFLVALVFYLVAMISVPAIVFFPAYSIHFFASRFPALDAILHPMPPSPPSPPPPPLSINPVPEPNPQI